MDTVTETVGTEEYFNAQFETIAVALLREGLEYNSDGKLVKFDTPYAMGVKDGEDIIAKQLKQWYNKSPREGLCERHWTVGSLFKHYVVQKEKYSNELLG